MASRKVRGLLLGLAWLVIALPAWVFFFTHSSASMVVASHDAIVTPTFDGHARIEMGPYLPDLRLPTEGRIGVDVQLGKTRADSTGELVSRYSTIASRPEAEVQRVTHEVVQLSVNAGLRAGVLALVPIALWLLIGRERRAELLRPDLKKSAVIVATGLLVLAVVNEPWRSEPEKVQPDQWLDLQSAIPEVPVPEDLYDVQVQGGLITDGTRRLVASAFDGYDQSLTFYDTVEERVGEIEPLLHQPADDETVAMLVSDRHDNIGMDKVVRKVADAGGATAVLDAGDDTSTGEPWETFSLDSLNQAFEGYDAHVAVSGNHDNGNFVNKYLKGLGWTHLNGKAAEPFGDVRFFGVDDPRSSGLGNWRDEKGLGFAEIKSRVGDAVCKLDEDGERVATLLVHDANLGSDALKRGCVDLILSGHLHVQVGPDRTVGTNGKVGYRYTTGTTGGAAYAVAIGKPRRDAQFTLVTYRDGRPVGVQPVTVRTTGDFLVQDYTALDLTLPDLEAAPASAN